MKLYKFKWYRKWIYKRMLRKFKKEPSGFCIILIRIGVRCDISNLPELYAFKPDKDRNYTGFYWFPLDSDGISLREHILTTIIKTI